MANHRSRVALLAGIALGAVWLVVLGGYFWARQTRVTADKVRGYISSVDFDGLSREQRALAVRKLAEQINALSRDERIKLHLQRTWENWFRQMTEAEKAAFVEATLPTGIKQMMAAFEEMPEARRKKTIDDAIKRLREAHELPIQNSPFRPEGDARTNSALTVNSDLEQQMRSLGLKTFYLQSSAQTKAEVAPLLEEMQRLMEGGAILR